VDPDTGHLVVRLTNEPGSASLYFNQNGYTPDGRHLIYSTAEGVSVLRLQDHTSRSVVPGRVRVIEVGHKTPTIYYVKDSAVWCTRIDTGETR
jgi:oligogalacturonide lyase